MALTAEDRTEIRQIMSDCNSGTHARTEAQYTIIDSKLDGISIHLTTLNGSVARHEKIIGERAVVIKDFEDFKETYKDVPAQIRRLEDESLSNKSVKKFMAYMFSSGVALGGLIVGLLKLILG